MAPIVQVPDDVQCGYCEFAIAGIEKKDPPYCVTCRKFFHSHCLAVNPVNWRKTSTDRRKRYVCSFCKQDEGAETEVPSESTATDLTGELKMLTNTMSQFMKAQTESINLITRSIMTANKQMELANDYQQQQTKLIEAIRLNSETQHGVLQETQTQIKQLCIQNEAILTKLSQPTAVVDIASGKTIQLPQPKIDKIPKQYTDVLDNWRRLNIENPDSVLYFLSNIAEFSDKLAPPITFHQIIQYLSFKKEFTYLRTVLREPFAITFDYLHERMTSELLKTQVISTLTMSKLNRPQRQDEQFRVYVESLEKFERILRQYTGERLPEFYEMILNNANMETRSYFPYRTIPTTQAEMQAWIAKVEEGVRIRRSALGNQSKPTGAIPKQKSANNTYRHNNNDTQQLPRKTDPSHNQPETGKQVNTWKNRDNTPRDTYNKQLEFKQSTSSHKSQPKFKTKKGNINVIQHDPKSHESGSDSEN